MKKILFYFLSAFFFIYTSCSDNESPDKGINKEELKNIAKQYGYKLKNSNTTDPILKVTTINELKNALDKIKNNFNAIKIKNLDNSFITTNNINHTSSLLDKAFQNTKTTSKTNKSRLYEDDPPYKHSTTVYFDNNFPGSNVYIRVDYNTDSTGNITGASVSSGSYGYSFGNAYSQIGVNTYISNGTLAFEVTGQITNSVGIGSFSMSNSKNITYTGFLRPNGGNPSGWVRQTSIEESPQDDEIGKEPK
jgi:hypothetical protein